MERALRDILGEKPQALFSVPPDATVMEAVKIMVEGQVGSVMVIEHGQLRGLFTERDLMRRVMYERLDPEKTAITDVMTKDVATVAPHMTVGEAMTFCTQQRLRHLPVFEGETLLGVISAGDLTKAAVADQQHTIDDLINYIAGSPA